MSQYWLFPANTYKYWTLSNGCRVAEGQNASGEFVVKAELYPGGFADAINVGWQQLVVNEGSMSGTYRDGIRACACVLDVGNFGGAENITWENLIEL